jgi:Txe/YoeB family toxin of Txe-Axe toxin-antitoxin module
MFIDPQESSFLASLADKLLAAPWHQKGKYEPLTILLKSIGSRRLLQQEPRLVHFLLDTMAESALAVHVSIVARNLPIQNIFVKQSITLSGKDGSFC